MPGKEEVEQACSILQKLAPDLMTLPIYAALPFETQCQIFSSTPQGVRKVKELINFNKFGKMCYTKTLHVNIEISVSLGGGCY